MTPLEVWKLTRDALVAVTGVHIIEAYDGRKAKDRPKGVYATLSLKAIKPVAMPFNESKMIDGELQNTTITPCELKFEFTMRRASYAFDLSYLINAMSMNEQCRRIFIENAISAWAVDEHERHPEKVNESYEDATTPLLVIAAPLSTTEMIGFADNVDYNINGLTGTVGLEKEPRENI